jgi:hypothetical protein
MQTLQIRKDDGCMKSVRIDGENGMGRHKRGSSSQRDHDPPTNLSPVV